MSSLANIHPIVVLGLDVGTVRVGVATGNTMARLAQPLDVIDADKLKTELPRLIKDQAVGLVVVGLPRNLAGEETEQSKSVRKLVGELSGIIDVPVVFQDETLSSVDAENWIKQHGDKEFAKDSVAAAIILQDYFSAPGGSKRDSA